MARIPIPHEKDPATPGKTCRLLDQQEREWGNVSNVFRAIGNHPDLLEHFISFAGGVFLGNGLGPETTELAYLAASTANQCHF